MGFPSNRPYTVSITKQMSWQMPGWSDPLVSSEGWGVMRGHSPLNIFDGLTEVGTSSSVTQLQDDVQCLMPSYTR